MKLIVFSTLLIVGFAFFARTIATMIRVVRHGNSDPRPRFDQIPARIKSVLIYFFGQKKVAESGPQHHSSKHHLWIFWGFLIITVGTAELLINGIVPSFRLETILPESIAFGIRWAIDFFSLVVLTLIGWAMFRRIVIKPPLIPMNLDAGIILGAIASLMITHFLYHGFHGAILISQQTTLPSYAPVSNIVAAWLSPVSIKAATIGVESSYWIHIIALLAFMNYLPFSKHIHLLGALPNIFFRNLSNRKMDLPKLDLEDENQWGVSRIEQFSWKALSDTYACTECARCSNYCPAYNTEKNLSPMQLIHDLRYEMIDRDALQQQQQILEKKIETLTKKAANSPSGIYTNALTTAKNSLKDVLQQKKDMEPLVGGRIQEDTLWACTTCGACQEVCPVFIEHPQKIIQMRQSLILEQEKIPVELGRMYRHIERQSNPWGISNNERMAWAEGLSVPTIEDNPNPEYILWVGCAGAFDQKIQHQTKAMIKILTAAKINYAVLGHNEGCTGSPARRSGNELLFQMQAETNIETLNNTGVQKIIASCPHCLHTLRHDYPQFSGTYEVIHHTQLIAHLLDEGKITVPKDSVDNVTYHDSCYLGRWNGEYEAPRKILNKLPIYGGVVEMKRNKEHGFCCGAGGGRMFMEEEGPRINTERTKEILDTKCSTVAVSCPFCNLMLTDGAKDLNADDSLKVLDVAELVAQSLSEPHGGFTTTSPTQSDNPSQSSS